MNAGLALLARHVPFVQQPNARTLPRASHIIARRPVEEWVAPVHVYSADEAGGVLRIGARACTALRKMHAQHFAQVERGSIAWCLRFVVLAAISQIVDLVCTSKY